jgi:hypothetical protein
MKYQPKPREAAIGQALVPMMLGTMALVRLGRFDWTVFAGMVVIAALGARFAYVRAEKVIKFGEPPRKPIFRPRN